METMRQLPIIIYAKDADSDSMVNHQAPISLGSSTLQNLAYFSTILRWRFSLWYPFSLLRRSTLCTGKYLQSYHLRLFVVYYIGI